MDYSLFTFNAVVDFIEVQIHTKTRNHGGRMQPALHLHGVSRVEPVLPDAGGWSSHFNITLNDLRTFAALQSKLAAIEEKYPFASSPIINMVEVAFDGYLNEAPAPHNRQHLVALAARMAYRLAEPVSNNRRIYRDRLASTMPRFLTGLERKMAEGWNVAIGNKTDDRYQHCYLKTTDRKQALPPNEHRARFEIRLAGAALPFTDPQSYGDFKFEALAHFISFRKEEENAPPLQKVIIEAYGDQASHRKNIPRRNGGGFRTAIMPDDAELNRIVRKRLQALTKRWQRPAAGAKKRPGK